MDDLHDAGSASATQAARPWRNGALAGKSVRPKERGLRGAVALMLAFGLAACTAVDDAMMSPEERAAQQPQRVQTTGV